MIAAIHAQARRGTAAALVVLAATFTVHAQDDSPRTAPFVTTPPEVVEHMLRLASTGAADTVLDLGSGDGRIAIAAAKLFGARGIGVDIDPKLVAVSRENARRAGVDARTEFHEGDALRTDLSGASVVTVYLLPFLIDQLEPKFLGEMAPGARIVTHAFVMTSWRPDRTEVVRVTRHSGVDSPADASEIYLWIVPAQARGEWQSPDWHLAISQNFQDIEVTVQSGGRTLPATSARLQGAAISFSGDGFSFRGTVRGDRIGGELTRGGSTVPVEFKRR